MPARVERLKTAIARGDIRPAGQQAHRIKGAASNVGGVVVQAVASSMEGAGKTGGEFENAWIPGAAIGKTV